MEGRGRRLRKGEEGLVGLFGVGVGSDGEWQPEARIRRMGGGGGWREGGGVDRGERREVEGDWEERRGEGGVKGLGESG